MGANGNLFNKSPGVFVPKSAALRFGQSKKGAGRPVCNNYGAGKKSYIYQCCKNCFCQEALLL